MDRFTTTPPIEEPREDVATLARAVRQIKYALETPSVLAAQLNELFNAKEVKRFEGIAQDQSSLTDQQALQSVVIGERFVTVDGQIQQVSGDVDALAGGLDGAYDELERLENTLDGHTANTNNPHRTDWATLLGKPTEFPPAPHTHVEADITDLDKYTQQEVDDLISQVSGGATDWADVTNKPTEFPPETHTHVVADVTDFYNRMRDKSIPNILLDAGSNSGFRARLAFGGDSNGAGACGIDALSNSSQLRLWANGNIEGNVKPSSSNSLDPLTVMLRWRTDELYVPLAGGQLTGPLGLPVTSAGSMPVGVEGEVVFCSDGDGGSPCLAVHDGTDWRRVALGATVSAT